MFQREYAKIIALYAKAKTLQNSSLDACVVHTFKFFFMLYKCSMWSPPTAQHQANMRICLKRLQHVMVHRVHFSCHSIFHVIGICLKLWNINYVVNILSQEKVTHSEVRECGRSSAEGEVFSTFPTNPSIAEARLKTFFIPSIAEFPIPFIGASAMSGSVGEYLALCA